MIPPNVLDWLAQEIDHTDQNEQGARETTIKRLDAERSRLHHRQSTLYDDKLDGKITKARWEEKSAQLQAQADEIERKFTQARETATSPSRQHSNSRASPAMRAVRSENTKRGRTAQTLADSHEGSDLAGRGIAYNATRTL